MRILVISDIHSNLVALEAVLAAAGEFDELWCLGDTIGYGPRPNECIEHMRNKARVAITGNHDLASLQKIDLSDFNPVARDANLWNGAQLTAENRAWIEPLPPSAPIDETFMIAHGSPRNPIWEYVLSGEQAVENFERLDLFPTQVCLIGHSHVQLGFRYNGQSGNLRQFLARDGQIIDLAVNDRFLLNPGSVGQPRDHDPRAAYAIIDQDAGTLQFHRIEYDIAATQQQMADAGLPVALIERLRFGR